MHFYFVSFNQHKKLILNHQKKRLAAQIEARKSKQSQKTPVASGGATSVHSPKTMGNKNVLTEEDPSTQQQNQQNKTIESLDDEDFL